MKVAHQLQHMENDLMTVANWLTCDSESIDEAVMTLHAAEQIQKLRRHFEHNWIGESDWPNPPAKQP